LYTPCILDCALRFLIKFSTYLSKKKNEDKHLDFLECLLQNLNLKWSVR
jgi:hypothetical protein